MREPFQSCVHQPLPLDRIICGDNCEVMRTLPSESIDLEEFEDAMIEDIDRMSKEEIEAELRAAGIDMAPAIAKLHAMIEAKKAEQKRN